MVCTVSHIKDWIGVSRMNILRFYLLLKLLSSSDLNARTRHAQLPFFILMMVTLPHCIDHTQYITHPG